MISQPENYCNYQIMNIEIYKILKLLEMKKKLQDANYQIPNFFEELAKARWSAGSGFFNHTESKSNQKTSKPNESSTN